MRMIRTIPVLLLAAILQQCTNSQSSSLKNNSINMDNKQKEHSPAKEGSDQSKKGNLIYSTTDTSKVNISEEEWKKLLPKDVYYIARQKGTERPWTSQFENFHERGTYYCAACGNPLFQSDTKFESGCGWPSFYKPISETSIINTPDHSHGMIRTEVQCGRCKAHLGHVFNDGPPPTGLRYCINGVILDFEKAKDIEKKYTEEGKIKKDN
ncbi:MAG: peptide-methionine (R)-S-oxide reductase MsrB [Bacteroidota bacterium]|nr:peptide-methionine (R)-S-oxide reductase MsrB [Bacteroidota bacterium]